MATFPTLGPFLRLWWKRYASEPVGVKDLYALALEAGCLEALLEVQPESVAAERTVGAYHAIGFFTAKPPSATLVAGLTTAQRVRGNAVVVTARGGGSLQGVRAVVQVSAVCAGGSRASATRSCC